MKNITSAKLDDIPEIVALAYKSFKETGKDMPKPQFRKVIDTLTNCVIEGIIFVDKDSKTGLIKGFIALTPYAVWWSEETIIETVLFYIQPEYRKGKTLLKLIKAAKQYSDTLGVPFRLEHFNMLDLDKKITTTKKLGFTEVSAGFLYGKYA